MVVGMLNWLIALGVSEKLSQIFSVSNVIRSDLSHWVMITIASLRKGPTLFFGFKGYFRSV